MNNDQKFIKTEDGRFLTQEEIEYDKMDYDNRSSDGQDFLQNKEKMQNIAKNTDIHRQMISIKIPNLELELFKKKSSEEWLKYQTKLNQIIYKYNRWLLTS